MAETSLDVIKRYLEDAIAAERSCEARLRQFAGEGDDQAIESAFHQHALETHSQYERLTARLEALGGSAPSVRGLLSQILGFGPRAAQTGNGSEEQTRQNLIMAFAIENSETAMYESLAAMAEAAGDTETESLARTIQAEEKATAEKFWSLLPSASARAVQRAGAAKA